MCEKYDHEYAEYECECGAVICYGCAKFIETEAESFLLCPVCGAEIKVK